MNNDTKIRFDATLEKFGDKGEKTGWTYIQLPEALTQQLIPGNKKSFRVKGMLDDFTIAQVAMIPMGEGDFILPINALMRKHLRKQKGAVIKVALTVDTSPLLQCDDLLACLREEPEAWERFTAMPQAHQHYYTKWIESAKTDVTRTKRIAMTVNAMVKGMDYGQMLRADRDQRNESL